MKKIKKIFSNAWVVGILGSIIATIILSAITAMYQNINIIQALKQVFHWALSVFTYKVPIYAIILVIIGLFIIAEVLIAVKSPKTNNLPKWLKYTKASCKSWIFTWEYQLSYNKEYSIEKLRPICQCGCELSFKEKFGNTYYSNGVLVCPKCQSTYPSIDDSIIEDVKKILIHNIKTEDYPHDL
jgi:hypothetical protein